MSIFLRINPNPICSLFVAQGNTEYFLRILACANERWALAAALTAFCNLVLALPKAWVVDFRLN